MDFLCMCYTIAIHKGEGKKGRKKNRKMRNKRAFRQGF